MHKFTLLSLSTLLVMISGLPQQLDTPPIDPGDPNVPAGDFVLPPQTPDPFPNGIPIAPGACDPEHLTEDCFTAMNNNPHGAFLYLDNNNGCTGEQIRMLKNGFWNAGQLLQEASKQAEARSSHYDLAADYWMGEDWTDYEKRIKDNIGRASNFVNNGKTSNYITVTCKDPKNYCKKDPIDGKQIGGYAWDYNGWTGKYGHITMCDPYFTLGTFAETVDKINNWKKTGENSKLYQMENYQTTGQFIVHEMMHLHSTYDPEPLITDIKLRVVGKAPPYAYGPYNVRRLAAGPKFPTKGDYGAALSTINSDSYTMLINSAFWWEIVGRLPGVSPEDSGVAPPNSPLLVFPRVSVANTSDFSIASVDSLLAQEIDLYFQKEDAPTPNDTPTPTPAPSDVPTQDQNACHGIGGDYWVRSRDVAAQNVVDFCGQTELEKIYNANSVNELKLSVRKLHGDSQTPRDAPDCVGRFTNAVIDGCDGADSLNNPHNYKFGSTLTTADGWEYKMTPLSQQVNQVSCDAQYKFFFDSFEIRGKNLPDALFGAEGEGLKKQIEGCGALTFWNFERTPDDCCFQWYAAGNLPIGTQACIGRALMSAGGSSIGRCWGIGKRQGEQNHQVNNKRQVNTTRQVDSIDSWPGYGDEGRHVFRNPPLIGRDNIDAWPGYGDEGKHVFKNATRQ